MSRSVESQIQAYEAAKRAATMPRMAKRGYSREFTPKTERRIKIEIDRVPPTLNDALRAKVKREGLSIRSLTLQLWKEWVASPRGGPAKEL